MEPAFSLYQAYKNEMHRIADLRYASAVLQWDQETYLPPKGAAFRGQQIATLSELAHSFFTGKEFGELLNRLSDTPGLGLEEKRNIELTREDFLRQQKLSPAFVRELTETINRSFHSWIEARKQNDFKVFSKDLEKLVQLKLQEAEVLGYEDHPYNALLHEYDRGSTVQLIDQKFNEVSGPLKNMLNKIMQNPQVDDSFLKQHFDKEKQWKFGMELLKDLGYDLEAGRQDISEHPFTTSFNSNDVRVTTRIDENDLSNMTWSCIHELGHALYEQGIPEYQYGLPLGEAASLTIHESQSRLWENHIGRSRAFCEVYLPKLQLYFPEQLGKIDVDQFYKAINKVSPSLIRTEADEVTYHFHVMIRYRLEKALLEKNINTSDIPAYWNEQYQQYLGIKVPNDREGCLQDVHWSHGSFGYFPTYSLGSFYAAHFYEHARKGQQGVMDTMPVLQWLRENIHTKGRRYLNEDLCQEATGETLKMEYFLSYLKYKYDDIYQLT